MRDAGFFRRPGLLLPAVLGPVVETIAVRLQGPAGSAALAPQVTAPPPLDLFHDLRWISVFHNSWIGLALELSAMVALRSLWVAWAVHRSWPSDGSGPLGPGQDPPSKPLPSLLASARWVAIFYSIAIVLFVPWVIVLAGQAISHVSFLFFAALPPALAIAAVLPRAAASHAAGRLWEWRPTWRSAGWVLAAFMWLSAAGAITATTPLPVAVLAAAAAGLANARAWFGVVQDIATRRERRPLRALAPALVGAIFAVTVGGTAIGFAVTSGHGHRSEAVGPPPAAQPGEHPVLLAAGLHSRLAPVPPLDLPGGYVGWRFSYRGLDGKGRPLPYGPGATQHSLAGSARLMALQVEELHRAYGEPVTLVGESEGALVARTYLLKFYRPDSHDVDRFITLDMPSGVAGVYFPPRGQQGWGVGTGWGLRGLAHLLGAIAPLDLSADSPLMREVLDCRTTLSQQAASPPPPGVTEVQVEALADWVDPPPAAPPGVPTYVIASTHGGLVQSAQVQELIRGIIDGDAGSHSGVPGRLAEVVGATARAWLLPTLPADLGPQPACAGA
ncbi:MAG: hypothetical protein M3Q23_14735 [Actinomycetota bacterium]|nr:hypothetical protein [Actinomycetota bacterium]